MLSTFMKIKMTKKNHFVKSKFLTCDRFRLLRKKKSTQLSDKYV